MSIHHPDRDELTLVDVMRALGDHVRLHMVMVMHQLGECECSLVYASLGLSKTNASHHLRVLRESGIVRRTQRGNQHYVQLRTNDLEERFPGLLSSVLQSLPEANVPRWNSD